jgi:hypothetical protein
MLHPEITMRAVSRILCLVAVSLLVVAYDAVAQSADELARQTQNPVASLISVPFQANWDEDEVWNSSLVFTFSKVTVLGKRPVNFVVGAGPQIASPTGGADWRLRIQANFLFPR